MDLTYSFNNEKGQEIDLDEEEEAHLLEDVIPNGSLQIGKVIGEGAFGSVNVGNLYGQLVAIKRFKISDDNKKEDIMNEVRVMRTLRHPNIVEYLGVAVIKRELCIVSEFMEGGTLDDYVQTHTKEKKMVRMKKVLKFLKDISRGLSWLHHRGIIHRDLKPTNILLDEDKRKCKIADFGLAHVKTSRRTSGHYGMCGTMCYAAPEVLNRKDYGLSADVFSFAMVATEIIDGQYPLKLEAIPTNDFTSAILAGERPDVPKRAPEKLKVLLESCWSVDQKKRPTAMVVFDKLVTIEGELARKNGLDPKEELEDILSELPNKALKCFDDLSKKIQTLSRELRIQKELTIRAQAEASTLEAELAVLKAAGARIDEESGLPEIGNTEGKRLKP